MSAVNGAMGAQFEISGPTSNKGLADVGGDAGSSRPRTTASRGARLRPERHRHPRAARDLGGHAPRNTDPGRQLVRSLDSYPRISKRMASRLPLRRAGSSSGSGPSRAPTTSAARGLARDGTILTPSFVIDTGMGYLPFPSVSSITDEIAACGAGWSPTPGPDHGRPRHPRSSYQGASLLTSRTFRLMDGRIGALPRGAHARLRRDQFVLGIWRCPISRLTLQRVLCRLQRVDGFIGISGQQPVTFLAMRLRFSACSPACTAAVLRARGHSSRGLGSTIQQNDFDVLAALRDADPRGLRRLLLGRRHGHALSVRQCGASGAGCANSVNASGA